MRPGTAHPARGRWQRFGLKRLTLLLGVAMPLGLLAPAQSALAQVPAAARQCTAPAAGLGLDAVSATVETKIAGRGGGIDVSPFCKLSGTLHPVPGSNIGFQLWLPDHWNGRLIMLGNGGYSSALPVEQMAAYVQKGYAVAATDTGHQGGDPDFAVGHPQAIDDWGWRAVHETAQAAKALARRHYGKAVRYSYFNGCSTGGHQALMEAQRFPGDFNGIVAGAPGNNRTRLNVGFLWQYVANHRADGSLILPPAKLKLLTQAALRSCGGLDALARGYLDDPFACHVDLAAIACKGEASEACLSPGEVGAAQSMYRGARNPRTGEQIYPPWLPGSESIGPPGMPLPGWSLYWADPANPAQPMRINFFRDWVFQDPSWDWRSFDFADLSPLAALSRRVDAIDPDLGAFQRAGGKLIQYHGLADPVVSPWDSRNYYEAVAGRSGATTADFYRLFFFPGMGHCGGGPGPNPLDPQTAIEGWVEQGTAPDALPAVSRGTGDESAPTSIAAYVPGG